MISRHRLVACFLVTWSAAIFVASAHEVGTTRVSARFDQGRYTIEIQADAASLVEKLDAIAGVSTITTPASGDAQRLREQLVARDDVFRGRLLVAFDGTVARPAIEYTVSPASDITSPPLATIRLTGDIPGAARDFTWSYSWTFAAYELALTAAGKPPITQRLEGGQVSAPFPVTVPPPALGRATIAWLYPSIFVTVCALRLRRKSADRVTASASPPAACIRPPTGDSTSDPSSGALRAW